MKDMNNNKTKYKIDKNFSICEPIHDESIEFSNNFIKEIFNKIELDSFV